MFWGITLESGKKYTQVLQRSFHVTMAALGRFFDPKFEMKKLSSHEHLLCEKVQIIHESLSWSQAGFEESGCEPVSVVADVNQAQFVLCSLQAGKIPQQRLDLIFTEGEEVSFSLEGDGEVHLTGNLLPTPQEYSFLSDEDTSSEEEEEKEVAEEENKDENFEKTVEMIKKDLYENRKKTGKVHEVSWQGLLSEGVAMLDNPAEAHEDEDWSPTKHQVPKIKKKRRHKKSIVKNSGKPEKDYGTVLEMNSEEKSPKKSEPNAKDYTTEKEADSIGENADDSVKDNMVDNTEENSINNTEDNSIYNTEENSINNAEDNSINDAEKHLVENAKKNVKNSAEKSIPDDTKEKDCNLPNSDNATLETLEKEWLGDDMNNNVVETKKILKRKKKNRHEDNSEKKTTSKKKKKRRKN